MVEPASTLGGGKLASEIVKRITPTLLEKGSHFISGRNVMVVGQSRAGKTSFYEFLRFGELEPEHNTQITYDEKKTRSFTVRIGRNSGVELRVWRVRDVPGQVGAVEHANLVQRRKPHALVIVTDMTAPIRGEPDRAAGAYLELFCRHLAEKLRTSWRTRRNLQSIIVLMNKRDRATPQKLQTREKAFRKVLIDTLSTNYGIKASGIPILPSVLVESKYGTSLADRVVRRLAKDLLN